MSQLLLLVSWFVKDDSNLKVGLLFILILVLVPLTFIAIFLPSQFVLLAAWVCVLIYLDIYKDSKADFFKGVTIFSWVMAILLTLTFVLSFDKICGFSSRWTLMVSDSEYLLLP